MRSRGSSIVDLLISQSGSVTLIALPISSKFPIHLSVNFPRKLIAIKIKKLQVQVTTELIMGQRFVFVLSYCSILLFLILSLYQSHATVPIKLF
jgi:hypothetical protein